MATRNVTISVNIEGKNNLAKVVADHQRQISESHRGWADEIIKNDERVRKQIEQMKKTLSPGPTVLGNGLGMKPAMLKTFSDFEKAYEETLRNNINKSKQSVIATMAMKSVQQSSSLPTMQIANKMREEKSTRERILSETLQQQEMRAKFVDKNRDEFIEMAKKSEQIDLNNKLGRNVDRDISNEAREKLLNDPNHIKSIMLSAQTEQSSQWGAKRLDSIRLSIEMQAKMQQLGTRDHTALMRAQLAEQHNSTMLMRKQTYEEYKVKYGAVAGRAKYFAEENANSMSLHKLLGFKAAMIGTAFSGNMPMTAGTLASSARLLTGELGLIAQPALIDLIKFTNTIRQGLASMSPETRRFSENAAKFAMYGSLAATAWVGGARAVGATADAWRNFKDSVAPMQMSLNNGARRTPFDLGITGRQRMAGLGVAGLGAAAFAYGQYDDSLFGNVIGSAGTGMMAGGLGRAAGLGSRAAGYLGLAIGGADLARRAFFQQNPILPGYIENPQAQVDSQENRALRAEIRSIISGSPDAAEIAAGTVGQTRGGNLQTRLLGRYGLGLQDVGLTTEMLQGANSSRTLNVDQVQQIENIVLNAVAGRRTIPGYTIPGQNSGPLGPPRPIVGPPRPPLLPGFNGQIPAPPSEGAGQIAYSLALGSNRELRNALSNESFLRTGVFLQTPDMIMNLWRQLYQQQQSTTGGAGNQNRPRSAREVIDNLSMNFQSEQGAIESIHDQLQMAAIRDPAQQRDAEQRFRENAAWIARLNENPNDNQRALFDALVAAMQTFDTVGRLLQNGMNR